MTRDARAPVRTDLANGILTVEIAREEHGNSIDRSTGRALLEAFTEAGSNPGLSAVVLESAGTKYYSTGGDVKEYAGLDRTALAEQFERMTTVCNQIERLDIPVITAMAGAALGGGVEVALACDIRFASPRSWIQFPNVGLGVITAWGGGQRLAGVVGRSRALEIMLSGRRVTASEAEAIGLVDRLFNDPKSAAAALARELTLVPREVVVAAKAHLRHGADVDEGSAEAMLDLWFEHGLIRAREGGR